MTTFNDIFKNEENHSFIRNSYEQTVRLIELLENISKKDFFQNLALKGGAAVNLAFHSLPRCFFDLDFDLQQDHFSLNHVKEFRIQLFHELNEICLLLGYFPSNKNRSSYSLDSFCYGYCNQANNKNYVKFEINYSLSSHILPLEKSYYFDEMFSFEYQRIQLLEILAIKISMLIYRGRVKDLFDVYQLMLLFKEQNFDINLLRKSVIFYYVLGTNNPGTVDLKNFEKINDYEAMRSLYPLNRKNHFHSTYNLNCASLFDMKKIVAEFIREILLFEDKELLFMERFYQGKYEIDLLYSDEEIKKRLLNHPMALWRTERK